jgi:hypothetical protein
MPASPTYPGDRNNDPKSNDFPTRDLALINQPAGAIEFVNTKDDEIVQISYKDGSFIKFNKFSTDKLNMNDMREHTQGDVFNEINGNQVNVVDKDQDNVVYGDKLTKIGDVDRFQKFYEQIKKKLRPLHDLKRLFEIKRTKNHDPIDQAPAQTKSGGFAPNPSDSIINKVLVTKSPVEYECATKAGPSRTIFKITKQPEETYEDVAASIGWSDFTSYGLGRSPSTQDGTWSKETQKDKILDERIKIQEELLELEKELGQNKAPSAGSEINKVAKDKIDVIGLVFNDFESVRKDPAGKLVPMGVKIDPLGKSVYTQYAPATLVETVAVDSMPGGKHHVTACDEYKLTVGSNGIDIKTSGPLEQYASQMVITTENYELNSSADIGLKAERIDLSADIISIRPNKKSRVIEDETGNIVVLPLNDKEETEIDGQLLVDGNLGITGNTIIKGGLHTEGNLTFHSQSCPSEFHITETDFEYGKDIQPPELSECEGGNVKADPTVDKDFPCQESEPPKIPTHADILPHHLIGYCLVECGDCAGCFPVYSVLAENSVMVHAHHHVYKLPPTKFVETDTPFDITVGNHHNGYPISPHDAVRSLGSRNNYIEPVLPSPIKHDYTNFTSLEKFGGATSINGACESITLSNGNWLTQEIGENKDEQLPSGMGIRTKENQLDELIKKAEEWNTKLEAQYKVLQEKLANIASV